MTSRLDRGRRLEGSEGHQWLSIRRLRPWQGPGGELCGGIRNWAVVEVCLFPAV